MGLGHTGEQLPDAVKGHWADTLIPEKFRPYMRMGRFERPIGWWLLLLPCWWSATLAAIATPGTYPNLFHMVLFLIGAMAMRGAGCAYNDILDRNLDGSVERTRMRPIPSGQVSVFQATVFLLILCLIGLAVLLSFNTFTIITGFASLGFVLVYPLMKRFFWVPQAVLGCAFNWGALVGWTAHTGSLSLAPFLLYFGGIFWTIGYDTIYALQDIEDDEIVGIKSSARFFGDYVQPAVGGCYVLAVLLMGGSLYMAGAGLFSYLGLAAFAGHLAWQTWRMDADDNPLSLKLFRSNRDAGLVFLAGLLVDACLF
jgi:4-hydroxybenzoate polyprenyl transferase, proteobacterial